MIYVTFGLGGLLILIVSSVYAMGVKSQKPKRKAIDRFPAVPYEEVQWHSQGDEIKGWFIPTNVKLQEKSAPMVIIAHGWGSNRVSMLRYIDTLHKEGYALLVYDARSHGESAGIPATSGISIRDDLLSALDYGGSRPEVDPESIGVLGHSLGAFGSVLALTRACNRIRAVITDAMPARTQTMMESELRKHRIPLFPLVHILPWIWYIRSHVSPRETNIAAAINSCNVPLLMIHSRRDNIIPAEEMDYIRSIAHRPAMDYVYLNCEGHSSSAKEPIFWEHVLPFLQEHLQSKPLRNLTESSKISLQ
jgi:pimeloyl-ACP methyl ester carboxylesterase